ncbi:MAG: cadherin-like domain-containing protein, partial [Rhodospirillales bacterium]|nr:cadherin-like domain-containing protein [Rhodospirillales bacterium]
MNAAPRIVTGAPAFERLIVDQAMPRTHVVAPVDLDGDGDIDLVSTSEQADSVVWFENNGSLSFTRHVIDAALESSYPASVADLDQDGDLDVLAAGYRDDLFVWYENDGAGLFGRRIIGLKDGPHSIFTGDFDADGDADLVTASQDANTVAWYENDGAENFVERVIDVAALAAKTALPVDVDGDGDLDVVTASFGDDTIAWYENNGAGGFAKHVIDTGANGAYYAIGHDIDSDGDVDIVAASRIDNSVSWYRNDGGQAFTKRVIDNDATAARSVFAVDVDGDGNVDVLSGSVDDDTVAWHKNNGDGTFTKHVVDRTINGPYGVDALDINRDGLVDVFAAGNMDGTVNIYLQTTERKHDVEVVSQGTLVVDRSILEAVDADDTPGELTYTLQSAPVAGELRLNGTTLGAGSTFTQADVDQGRLAYVHTVPEATRDGFDFTLADAGGAGAAPARGSFAIEVLPPPPQLVSDDFSGAALDARWSQQGPAGTVSLAAAGNEAFVELAVPAGKYQPWKTNTALRLMQEAEDGDFGIEVRFLSVPTQRHQLQGLLVEQDGNDWIRFDTHHDGSTQRIFAAVTVNGVSTTKFSQAIAAGSAAYLRAERDGDLWTFSYSADGQSWTVAGSFSHAMAVSAVGPFAGTTSPAFTAQIDYFFNTAAPIVDEDAGVDANAPPVAQDDVAGTMAGVPLTLAVADLLANDSDADGEPLQLLGFAQPLHGTLTDNGDGTLRYTPDSGFSGSDSFVYTVGDGTAQDTATVQITVAEPPPQLVSDDFSGAALDARWSQQGPAGTVSLAAA